MTAWRARFVRDRRALLILLLAAGCGQPKPATTSAPALTEAAAVALASRVGADAGYDVSAYEARALPVPGGGWTVLFDRHELSAEAELGGDNHFGVSIGPDGRTYLARGR
jgi:hypothetical protein